MSLAANFIWSDSPLEILGTVTSITFSDPADLAIKEHDLTTEEVFLYGQAFYNKLKTNQGMFVSSKLNEFVWQVKALCDDLRVLGKQDFKHLLK